MPLIRSSTTALRVCATFYQTTKHSMVVQKCSAWDSVPRAPCFFSRCVSVHQCFSFIETVMMLKKCPMAAGLPFRVRRTSQEDPSSLSPETHPVSGTGIQTPPLPRRLDFQGHKNVAQLRERAEIPNNGSSTGGRSLPDAWSFLVVLLEECQTVDVFRFIAGSLVGDKFEIIVRHFIDFRLPHERMTPACQALFRGFWVSRMVHRSRVYRPEARLPHCRSVDVNNTTGTRLQQSVVSEAGPPSDDQHHIPQRRILSCISRAIRYSRPGRLTVFPQAIRLASTTLD